MGHMQSRTVLTLSISFFVALLLYGLYVNLIYLGVPVHSAVLVPEATLKMLANSCGNADYLCRGLASMVPALGYFIIHLQPFFGYIMVSLVLFAGIMLWKAFQEGSFMADWRIKPWQLGGAFLLAVWVMFTSLGMGSDGTLGQDAAGNPVPRSTRLLITPSSDFYPEPNVLELMQKDFTDLQNRHCLTDTGMNLRGSQAYLISVPCMQTSFITRVLSQLVITVLFVLCWLALGSLVLRLVGIHLEQHLPRALTSVVVGAAIWITCLWLCAIAHIYIMPVGWLLVVASLLLSWREVLTWFAIARDEEIVVERGAVNLQLWLGWLLISLLALNYLSVVRPFPIGWDDLGSYLNRPRLLVSYGQLIASMSSFQWEYMTSLGFLLFGYSSPFGATASMLVNWLAGALATFAILVLGRTMLGRGTGVLSALLYYSLPLVGHFSFADMKVDNALMLFSVAALLLLFMGLPAWRGQVQPVDGSYKHFIASTRGRLLVLCGVMAGFAFGIKATAAILILTLFILPSGILLGWLGLIGAIGGALFPLWRFGGLRISDVLSRVTGMNISHASTIPYMYIICPLVCVIGIGLAYYYSKNTRKHIYVCLSLFIGLTAAILPWQVYNNIDNGNVVPTLVLRSVDRISVALPALGPEGGVLTGPLALSTTNEACISTAKVEELDRYWGSSQGISHYLLLPWRTVMNSDSAGYYVTTMPILLLLPLLLLLPFFWLPKGKSIRWLAVATVCLVIMWIFTGNGVPWYGLPLFAGAVILVEAMYVFSPDLYSRFLMLFLIFCSLVSNTQNRLWKFDELRNTLDYGFGKISARALEATTINWYSEISNRILERRQTIPDRPYAYRIGTFIPYFIPRNLEVLRTADHQLDVFTCLYQERDAALTLERMKALGFNSIIFDTNTATIEKDPNGTLHRKVSGFQSFVNENVAAKKMNLLINDTRAGIAYIEIP